MAEQRWIDRGYCRGCGMPNPCTKTHKGEEAKRLEAIAEQERAR